jgi:hypothetical protein
MAHTTLTPHRTGAGRLLAPVRDDAALDGADARLTRVVLGVPVAVLAVLALVFVVHRPWFFTLQVEDGAVEWTQFALVLLCAVVAAGAALRFARAGQPLPAVLMLLLALGALGLAGEEISWGQRVLGVATPGELAAANHQAEMNLHNVNVGIDAEDLFKVVEFVLGIVAAALSLTARRRTGRLYPTRWWLVAPALMVVPGFVAISAYRALMLVTPSDLAALVAFQEGAEVLLYFSLAVTAVCGYVRATPGRYRVDLTGVPERTLLPTARADLRPVWVAGVLVVVLTVVFAVLSAHSGIDPGNLPGNPGYRP